MRARPASRGETIGPEVNFVAVASAPRWKESPQCFRCGRCEAACPASLPVDLMVEGRARASADPGRCIQCGACSAVCLAGRDLAASMGELKERRASA